jgi:phage head maturation protease
MYATFNLTDKQQKEKTILSKQKQAEIDEKIDIFIKENGLINRRSTGILDGSSFGFRKIFTKK